MRLTTRRSNGGGGGRLERTSVVVSSTRGDVLIGTCGLLGALRVSGAQFSGSVATVTMLNCSGAVSSAGPGPAMKKES